ncbi:hypothetical protein Hanom_Chr00s002708g01703371 [Helianthus anomalus]
MALIIKKPHNHLPNFEKTTKNTIFHSINDVLSSSKYKAILTGDASIHVETFRQFWANAEVQSQNKKPYAITSKVGETIVQISPSSISTVFALDDQASKTS